MHISNIIYHIENKSAPFTYRCIENGEYMPKKENLIFATLLMLGILDWLTTIMGVTFFGASEQNMILAGFIQSNLFVFSLVLRPQLAYTTADFFFFNLLHVIESHRT